jgi:hypothetical protein
VETTFDFDLLNGPGDFANLCVINSTPSDTCLRVSFGYDLLIAPADPSPGPVVEAAQCDPIGSKILGSAFLIGDPVVLLQISCSSSHS